MEFDIEKAIKYPFEDPNWKKKIGVYIGIQVIISLVITALNTAGSFMPSSIPIDEAAISTTNIDWSQVSVYISPMFAIMLVSFFSLPIQLYLSGYVNETLRNIKNNMENPVAEHVHFFDKIKLWWDVAVVAAGPFILNMIVFTIAAIPLIFFYAQLFFDGILTATADLSTPLLIVTIIATFVAILLIIASSLITSALVYPAMLFIYFKTGSSSQAYNYRDVITVIKAGWKKFILISLINWGVGTVVGTLAFVACIASFLVKPILVAVQKFMNAYFLGNTFRDMERDGVLVNMRTVEG